MVRYPFTWQLQELSGGGTDANNDPIPQTENWVDFICDAQSGSGMFSVGNSGDKINVSYLVYIAPGQGLTINTGDRVKDHHGKERIILESEYNYFTV